MGVVKTTTCPGLNVNLRACRTALGYQAEGSLCGEGGHVTHRHVSHWATARCLTEASWTRQVCRVR